MKKSLDTLPSRFNFTFESETYTTILYNLYKEEGIYRVYKEFGDYVFFEFPASWAMPLEPNPNNVTM